MSERFSFRAEAPLKERAVAIADAVSARHPGLEESDIFRALTSEAVTLFENGKMKIFGFDAAILGHQSSDVEESLSVLRGEFNDGTPVAPKGGHNQDAGRVGKKGRRRNVPTRR